MRKPNIDHLKAKKTPRTPYQIHRFFVSFGERMEFKQVSIHEQLACELNDENIKPDDLNNLFDLKDAPRSEFEQALLWSNKRQYRGIEVPSEPDEVEWLNPSFGELSLK